MTLKDLIILTVLANPHDGEGEGDPPAGDPPKTAGDPPAGDPSDPTKLQKEIEQLRKAHQDALSELESATKKANMTAKQRKEADERIEQMRNQFLTKEQQQQKENEKREREYKLSLENVTTERDEWKTKYTKSTIQRSITDAAAQNKAFDPAQVVALIGPKTTLVEGVDKKGDPTGELVPMVKFDDTDKEGNPVTLDLTPDQAVKRMTEIDRYFNLFQGEGTGGLGSRNNSGGKELTLADLSRMAKEDPQAYREARKKFNLE